MTVKPVLSGHSKIDQTNVLKTNGSLIMVESIAECSLRAFCNTFYLHLAIIGLKNQFWSCEWPFKTGFNVHYKKTYKTAEIRMSNPKNQL